MPDKTGHPKSPLPVVFIIIVVAGFAFAWIFSIVRDMRNNQIQENKTATSAHASFLTPVPMKFENSPFKSARYNILDDLIFENVASLNGRNAWISIEDQIDFLVGGLNKGEAIISGELKHSYQAKSGCKTSCTLKKVEIRVSDGEEYSKWSQGLKAARENLRKKNASGPILDKPQKISPPSPPKPY